MAKNFDEWNDPLKKLEEGITKLKDLVRKEDNPAKREDVETKITELEKRRDHYIDVMFQRLGPWEKVLVARAPKRPYTLDYIGSICTDFVELQGDRRGFTDNAIIGGPAMFDGTPVMVVGHQKGRNIQERQFRNFGMAKPEGYRKAIRLFDMAERFRMPVISFVDTPAADPGVESESRGISEAIAAGMFKMFELTVPTVAVVIGEGGSGGAIGIAASNRVLMMEHSVYSVIPPEGCAAILWRMPERGAEAAQALKLTAEYAMQFGVIDEIVPEPKGGAHRDPLEAAQLVKAAIAKNLAELSAMSGPEIKKQRYDRFRKIGIFEGA